MQATASAHQWGEELQEARRLGPSTPKTVTAPNPKALNPNPSTLNPRSNVGALIIRIRVWGIFYYSHKKEPPKIVLVII